MGIGDWGLGIGDWGLGPIPNPHIVLCLLKIKNNKKRIKKIFNFLII